MSKFTAGKWTPYYDGRVEIRVNDRIEHYYLDLIGADEERLSANARLIAAAPEMYKLLNALVHREYDNTVTTVLMSKAQELLARIDSEEAEK